MRLHIIITSLIFSIFLTGCISPPINTSTQSETSLPKSISTSIATAPILVTISQTSTQLPSQTTTATPIPTWTPLPTLELTAALFYVENLLQNNGGCRLPCWWGFTPGTSEWNLANQYLKSFTLINGPINYEEDGRQKVGYQVDFQTNNEELGFGLDVHDEIINNFGIPPETSVYGYKLDQLLTKSGRPEEIWLAPMPDTPGGSWYYLVIYSPAQGIMARYGGGATPSYIVGNDGIATITNLHICPIGVGPELWLVPPNTLKGVKGNSALGGTAFTDILIPIQQATGMSVEEFYKTFRSGDISTCFDTPSESWP
jgi:hypothetical protein